MRKNLKLKDFKFILINKKRKEGYYSFKRSYFEIGFDEYKENRWLVFLCNRFGEVVREMSAKSKQSAFMKASNIYKNIDDMLCD